MASEAEADVSGISLKQKPIPGITCLRGDGHEQNNIAGDGLAKSNGDRWFLWQRPRQEMSGQKAFFIVGRLNRCWNSVGAKLRMGDLQSPAVR